MQNAVIVTKFDPANYVSTLDVVQKPIPAPQPGQVLVRVTCRPINPADIFSLQGVYPGFAPKELPATPGLEGCGVIEDGNDSKLAKGTRVIVFFNTIVGDGSWQEFVAVPASSCIPIPDSISDESACQFLVNPVTVEGMFRTLNIPQGEYLIQSAAGSVLGRQVIALAKLRGIKTINIVRRAEQIAELKALGADEVLCSEDGTDIIAAVKNVTGGKLAYAGIDAVAGKMTSIITGSLRNNGTALVYGAMAGISYDGNVIDLLFRGITLKGFWLVPYLHGLDDAGKQELFSTVIGYLASGQLVPFSGESFSLSQIKEAVQKATSSARGGKVLLK